MKTEDETDRRRQGNRGLGRYLDWVVDEGSDEHADV
jgi:hypothetical protein